MTHCQGCNSNDLREVIDFGLLPISNQFKKKIDDSDFLFSLVLKQCLKCTLIQINPNIPYEEIIPKVDWIKYSEPENHLDEQANIVCNLFDFDETKSACGITYKDKSFLDRLKQKGFKNTWVIDPHGDLGLSQRGIASETILPLFDQKCVTNLKKKYGQVDLVVARHILEHAPKTLEYISLLSDLVNQSGYILIEVPDCTKQLICKDYTMPWEEHILYFTQETLKNIFSSSPLEIVNYNNYDYPTENSQVVILKKTTNKQIPHALENSSAIKLTEEYSLGYSIQKKRVTNFLNQYKHNHGKIVFYGAGHLAVMIIASFNLEDFIEFIVDDTKEKHGYFLPGTKLVIKSPRALTNKSISLCVLCLSVENQSKVIDRNQVYIKTGGKFLSLFPMQKNSLTTASLKSR